MRFATPAGASMNATDTPFQSGTRLLRMPQVIDRIGLKKTVIYERIKEGTFPKPVKLGSASVWPENEVDAWIAQQVRQARAAA